MEEIKTSAPKDPFRAKIGKDQPAAKGNRATQNFGEREVVLNKLAPMVTEDDEVEGTHEHVACDNDQTALVNLTDDEDSDEDLRDQIERLKAELNKVTQERDSYKDKIKVKKAAKGRVASKVIRYSVARRAPARKQMDSLHRDHLQKVQASFDINSFESLGKEGVILGDTFSLNPYIGTEKALSVACLWSSVRSTAADKKGDKQEGRKLFYHLQNEYTTQSLLSDIILKLGTRQAIKKTLTVTETFITGAGPLNKQQREIVKADPKHKTTDKGKIQAGQQYSYKREKVLQLREITINLAHSRVGIVFGGHCYVDLAKANGTYHRVNLADANVKDMFYQEFLVWSRSDFSTLVDITEHYPYYLNRYLTSDDMLQAAQYAEHNTGAHDDKERFEPYGNKIIAEQEADWKANRAKYIAAGLSAADDHVAQEEEKALKAVKTRCSALFKQVKDAKLIGDKKALSIEIGVCYRDAATVESKIFLKRTMAQAFLRYAEVQDFDKKLELVNRRLKQEVKSKWGHFKFHGATDVYNACVARLANDTIFDEIPVLPPSIEGCGGFIFNAKGEMTTPKVMPPAFLLEDLLPEEKPKKKRHLKVVEKEQKKEEKKKVTIVEPEEVPAVEPLKADEKQAESL